MRRIETQRGKPRDRDERNQNNQKIIKSSTRRESKAATSTKQKPEMGKYLVLVAEL